jgi:hypothetical protein
VTADAWAALVTGVVVPLVLRIVAHYWPWLTEDPAPTPRHRRDDGGRS